MDYYEIFMGGANFEVEREKEKKKWTPTSNQ
jgi:hypothetical protein